MKFRKIVNDPVYGFITFDDELIYRVLELWFFAVVAKVRLRPCKELEEV